MSKGTMLMISLFLPAAVWIALDRFWISKFQERLEHTFKQQILVSDQIGSSSLYSHSHSNARAFILANLAGHRGQGIVPPDSQFFHFFSNCLTSSNMRLFSFAKNKTHTSDNLISSRYLVEVTGTMRQLRDFMVRLEHGRLLTVIEEIQAVPEGAPSAGKPVPASASIKAAMKVKTCMIKKRAES
ncbi:hypothetical protein ACFL5V_12450 [Fibrobacterota bacterium]